MYLYTAQILACLTIRNILYGTSLTADGNPAQALSNIQTNNEYFSCLFPLNYENTGDIRVRFYYRVYPQFQRA